MSFNSKLIDLLKTDPRFVDDDGEVILAAVQDHAWKIDHDLIKLLLSDKETKAKFFDEIESQPQEREREREREREFVYST